ncbi:MAG: hypothetical protein KY453_09810 [Gemmatimonadetes bacterium]|nr:hypothetical protein [Gemmatimonadota bacterium]
MRIPTALLPLLASVAFLAGGEPAEGQAAAGQASVRSARLFAVVAEGGTDVEVRVDYRVALEGPAPAGLRLEILGFGPASVERFGVETPGAAGVRPPPSAPGGSPRAATADAGVPAPGTLPLTTETGSMRTAVIPLAALAPASGEASFSLVYRVAGAVERSGPRVRVRLPILVVDLPPEPGASRIFDASVRLPEAWAVSGGFPTGLARTAGGTWEVRLPVVPALVSLRGRSDGAWRPGMPEALDALAAIVLVGFGLVGWRHLRKVAA